MTHRASCSCGRLQVEATGDPVRISVCHCMACKRRTGSAFSAQMRWLDDQVSVNGVSSIFSRVTESGATAFFHFCPNCGATVHFSTQNLPGMTAIPLGALDDPFVAGPAFSIYEESRLPWVEIIGEGVEHID